MITKAEVLVTVEVTVKRFGIGVAVGFMRGVTVAGVLVFVGIIVGITVGEGVTVEVATGEGVIVSVGIMNVPKPMRAEVGVGVSVGVSIGV